MSYYTCYINKIAPALHKKGRKKDLIGSILVTKLLYQTFTDAYQTKKLGIICRQDALSAVGQIYPIEIKTYNMR